MSENKRKIIQIDERFFCDGHGYLITSQSLGGSDFTPTQISNILFENNQEKALELFTKGICFPIGFEGDCALDEVTQFVIGDLNETEEKDWIARLVWKLNIPCGKLILCCGWCEDELISAVAGKEPPENDVRYQIIDVPPNEYLVEIYAYASSLTVECSAYKYDEELEREVEDEELFEWYQENHPGIEDIDYIIRLKPLENEPKMPEVEETWFEKFEFRKFNN